MASIVFDGRLPDCAVLADLEEQFDADDQRFSLYCEQSEINRLARGELAFASSSTEFQSAYARAAEWRLLTYGAFTPARPDGVLDLSGIVKALSIEKARLTLERHGVTDVIVDVGGDAVAMGAKGDSPWLAGIIDPEDRSHILCAVLLEPGRAAIATSGTAERGEHIWQMTLSPYVQATVVAPDIVTADVLATAILAGGRESRDDITGRWAVDVLTVDRNGTLEMTPGMRAKTRVTAAAVSAP